MTQSRPDSGFTLIEILVVVIILAALAGMVLPRVIPRADEARRDIARGEIAGISTALNFFRLDVGRYPSTEEGLAALMASPSGSSRWKGPYLEKRPDDPWSKPYAYRYPGSHNPSGFDVWSLGPDGQEATQDDVGNWE
ncbi:MAG: type II secretion system protein GspG [Lentisphaerae bacterium]|nr:type II secretion system protein GspG [Lentisphaerota bacterium]